MDEAKRRERAVAIATNHWKAREARRARDARDAMGARDARDAIDTVDPVDDPLIIKSLQTTWHMQMP
ncbi:hypothetical protein BPOR_0847g00020 [Botrytis porri]|uniref:Uncharacterized protein n=1 Tax=Botrytis porri TaxID=87229 RepID=A0A4Z1K8E8_9HELO|nr:hypothetical protein BPOR_0847g00020 [Botrytis porri]